MAEKLRIFPLLASQLQFSVSAPIFEPLAVQVLGNAVTPEDGFDADLQAVVDQLDVDTKAIADADADLASADFVPGEFAAANIDPLISDVGVFTKAGDVIQQELDDSAQVPSAAPPQAESCTFIQGNFDLPPCDFGNTPVDSIYKPGPMQFGDCKRTLSTNLFGKDGNRRPISSVFFVTHDRVFSNLDVYHNPENPRFSIADDRVVVDVDGNMKGHFQCVVRAVVRQPSEQYTLGICIDIVDSTDLQGQEAPSVLPLQG